MADTGMGNFAEVSPIMADLMAKSGLGGKVFKVGEELKIKQSNFTQEEIADFIETFQSVHDKNMQEDNRSRFACYGSKSLSIIEQLNSTLTAKNKLIDELVILLDEVLCEVAVSCTLKYEIKQAMKKAKVEK